MTQSWVRALQFDSSKTTTSLDVLQKKIAIGTAKFTFPMAIFLIFRSKTILFCRKIFIIEVRKLGCYKVKA